MGLHAGSMYFYATGSIHALNVTDSYMVKALANCKALDLGKPCFLQKERGALVGMGILMANGDLWVHQRKDIAPEFFMDKVKVKYWENIFHAWPADHTAEANNTTIRKLGL